MLVRQLYRTQEIVGQNWLFRPQRELALQNEKEMSNFPPAGTHSSAHHPTSATTSPALKFCQFSVGSL
jgi:hypothetical protein